MGQAFLLGAAVEHGTGFLLEAAMELEVLSVGALKSMGSACRKGPPYIK